MTVHPLTLEQPLDIDDARTASRAMSMQRRAAEKGHEDAVAAAAEAERDYRKALARAIVAAEGTAAEREAVARADVADLSYARDIAAGMVKVWSERLRGLEGERSQLQSLISWSARVQDQSEPRHAA